MSEEKSDLLLGTLDMLVLRVLALESLHGWGLSLRLEQITDGVFQVNQGSLYPALQRLVRKGWITAAWQRSENNRRARYYSITAAGRRRLETAVQEWQRVSGAVNRVLDPGWQEV